MPTELLRVTPEVGAPARLVLAALWSWANPRHQRPFVFPSPESVAERCGMAPRTTRRHLGALRRAGLIEAGEVVRGGRLLPGWHLSRPATSRPHAGHGSASSGHTGSGPPDPDPATNLAKFGGEPGQIRPESAPNSATEPQRGNPKGEPRRESLGERLDLPTRIRVASGPQPRVPPTDQSLSLAAQIAHELNADRPPGARRFGGHKELARIGDMLDAHGVDTCRRVAADVKRRIASGSLKVEDWSKLWALDGEIFHIRLQEIEGSVARPTQRRPEWQSEEDPVPQHDPKAKETARAWLQSLTGGDS